ncbi:MAG: HAMP domain-containing histidine kinase [Planctomycetes bacterium]|nr:HAMP domain-containing histidine kinase [Planctomycetota bacterium]
MKGVAPERLPGLIGHELRNPLAAAVTGAMLAREMSDTDDPRAPVLDGVLRDLDRAARLLDSWLQLARTANVQNDPVRLDQLVRSVAGRNRVDVVVAGEPTMVRGDELLLERVFENLFDNARKAGAARIRVALQGLGDDAVVHVEDDGCGVPREDVERIFAPGWSTRGSAGLGLHTVATTLAAHGGCIRCVPLARGTRFSITLPLAAQAVGSA